MIGGRSRAAAQRLSGLWRPLPLEVCHRRNKSALNPAFNNGIIKRIATTTALATSPPVPADDRMPVHGIDHVEMYVGNAAQAAFYFTHAFGFTETAYAGLETGRRDRVSHVLEQGRIRLVLTGTLQGGDEIAAHQAIHGDGVHKIALSVPDAEAAYHHAVEHGARGIMTPHWVEDEHGRVQLSSIATYGDTQHLFVQREGYKGAFLPGFEKRGEATHDPAAGKRKSQIEEYIEYYKGAGAQHIAVATRDIVGCVSALRESSVDFLSIPESYYDEVPERIGEIEEDLADLRRLGILVDRDDEGYLLQIFTKPVGDRPTVFFEIIERHGSRGF